MTLAEGVIKARTRSLRPPAGQAGQAAPRPLPLGPPAPHDAARRRPPARRHPGRGRHPPRGTPGRGRAAPHHRRGRQHALALKHRRLRSVATSIRNPAPAGYAGRPAPLRHRRRSDGPRGRLPAGPPARLGARTLSRPAASARQPLSPARLPHPGFPSGALGATLPPLLSQATRGAAAPVHEIFISYSSKHRDLTRELAAVLEAAVRRRLGLVGHRSWRPAPPTPRQIRAALEQARVVVVIWTAGAMVSDCVYAEAAARARTGQAGQCPPGGHELPRHPRAVQHPPHRRAPRTTSASSPPSPRSGTARRSRPASRCTRSTIRQHGRRLIDPKQKPLPRERARSPVASCCRPSTPSSPTPTSPAWRPSCWLGAPTIPRPPPAA